MGIWYGKPRMPDSRVWILLCWQPKGCVSELLQKLSDLIRALEGKSGNILLDEAVTLD